MTTAIVLDGARGVGETVAVSRTKDDELDWLWILLIILIVLALLCCCFFILIYWSGNAEEETVEATEINHVYVGERRQDITIYNPANQAALLDTRPPTDGNVAQQGPKHVRFSPAPTMIDEGEDYSSDEDDVTRRSTNADSRSPRASFDAALSLVTMSHKDLQQRPRLSQQESSDTMQYSAGPLYGNHGPAGLRDGSQRSAPDLPIESTHAVNRELPYALPDEPPQQTPHVTFETVPESNDVFDDPALEASFGARPATHAAKRSRGSLYGSGMSGVLEDVLRTLDEDTHTR
jgi:hypothetical protein